MWKQLTPWLDVFRYRDWWGEFLLDFCRTSATNLLLHVNSVAVSVLSRKSALLSEKSS